MALKFAFKEDGYYGLLDIKSYFEVDRESSDHTYGFYYPYHYHPWYELYFLIEGSCTFTIGKNKYVLNSGDTKI